MHIQRTVPSATTPGLESSDAAAAPRASALSPEEAIAMAALDLEDAASDMRAHERRSRRLRNQERRRAV